MSNIAHWIISALMASPFYAPPPAQEVGWATWYGDGWGHGAVRADGAPFDPGEVGCAHRTIPLGTEVVVEAKSTGRRIVCEINDRGPYAVDDPGSEGGWCNGLLDDECVGEPRAILDLSLAAARLLWDSGGDRPPNGDVILRYQKEETSGE